jgi:hypothetical protein
MVIFFFCCEVNGLFSDIKGIKHSKFHSVYEWRTNVFNPLLTNHKRKKTQYCAYRDSVLASGAGAGTGGLTYGINGGDHFYSCGFCLFRARSLRQVLITGISVIMIKNKTM